MCVCYSNILAEVTYKYIAGERIIEINNGNILKIK